MTPAPVAYADLEGHIADRLPAGPVDAIGFSMGARLLLGVAIAEPHRFRRIVTLGVGRNMFEASGSEVVIRAVEAGGDPDNPVAAYFARLADHPDARLVVLRGADHFSTPKDFGAIDATLRFLDDGGDS